MAIYYILKSKNNNINISFHSFRNKWRGASNIDHSQVQATRVPRLPKKTVIWAIRRWARKGRTRSWKRHGWAILTPWNISSARGFQRLPNHQLVRLSSGTDRVCEGQWAKTSIKRKMKEDCQDSEVNMKFRQLNWVKTNDKTLVDVLTLSFLSLHRPILKTKVDVEEQGNTLAMLMQVLSLRQFWERLVGQPAGADPAGPGPAQP